MMDFIMVPLVVGIITLGIYKLFELFARRKERMLIIEKLGDKLEPSLVNGGMPIPVQITGKSSFGALKAGSLLVGVGLGLLIGFLILSLSLPSIDAMGSHNYSGIVSIVYGSSVLLFGGLGLLVAFFVEMKTTNKNKGEGR